MRLSIAVLAIASSSGAALAAAGDRLYAKRVQILETLASRYPGRVGTAGPYGRYGLWAGILVQTIWQQRTDRDRILLRSLVNEHLSVEPTSFARLLAHSGADDARTACRRSPRPVECEGWVRYLLGARRALPAATLQKLLWHAHTTSIVSALRAQRAALDRVRTTTLEHNFWAGWIEVVFMLEAVRFPTDGATSVRASRLLMPPCSPLGAPDCRLTLHDLGRAFPFVSALALRSSASIDGALRVYATLRSRGARAALAAVDPSLGLALRPYLATAR